MSDAFVDAIFTKKIAQFYEALETEWRGRLLDGYSFPFVTYVGRDYYRTSPRILYVGQATNGWGFDQVYREDAAKREMVHLSDAAKNRIPVAELVTIADNFVRKSIEKYYATGKGDERYARSNFWRWIYRLTVSIQKGTPQLLSYADLNDLQAARDCFTSIAWTNLFKVDKEGQMPDKTMREFLHQHFQPLRDEIECLKPTLIVFFTHSRYDCELRRIFPAWTPEADVDQGYSAEIRGVSTHALTIRTCHPGYKQPKILATLYEFVKERLGIS